MTHSLLAVWPARVLSGSCRSRPLAVGTGARPCRCGGQGLCRPVREARVLDVVVAMTLAGLVNAAMLVMAASTFWAHGLTKIASIEEAHRTLTPLLGGASSVVFAVSLLASGLSSSTVGTMAGQIIMQGFLHRQVSVWIRRLVTMVPAIAVVAMGLDPTRTLVISQVVLSFGLPFALVPLVLFTRRRDLMGSLANAGITTVTAALMTALIVALNVFLIYQTFRGG